MFLAHVPAGYIVSKFFISQLRLNQSRAKLLMCIGLLGSIFPDLDMFYFYFIDHRQHGHHSYWTHIPFYWITLLLFVYVIAVIFKSRLTIGIASVFIGSVLTHLLLDTFAGGGIKWLYPISKEYFNVFSIPSQHNFWIWNYILHWTMLVEIFIISSASIIYIRARNY